MKFKKILCAALFLLTITNMLSAATQSQRSMSPVTSIVCLAGALGLGLFLGFMLRSSIGNESPSVVNSSPQNCALKNLEDRFERLKAEHGSQQERLRIDMNYEHKQNVEQLETELEDTQEGIQQYLSLVEQNMQNNKDKIKELREELARCQAENVQYAGKIEDEEKDRAAYQENMVDIQGRLARTDTQLSKREKDYKQLDQDYRQLSEHHEQLKKQLEQFQLPVPPILAPPIPVTNDGEGLALDEAKQDHSSESISNEDEQREDYFKHFPTSCIIS